MKTSLRNLKDAELVTATKNLVARERETTAEILRHLAEIERRKLYADFRCGSLFEYAVRELGYSEGSAQRRISSMRLMREIPEIESKIESGALNLMNISQAQSLFRDLKKAERPLETQEKMKILEKLENKSAREGERVLMSLNSYPQILPRERSRQVTEQFREVSFLVSSKTTEKMDEVRALLGPKGGQMSIAELFDYMCTQMADQLAKQRFGKKRVEQGVTASAGSDARAAGGDAQAAGGDAQAAGGVAARSRYISREVKFQVRQKAQGKCTCCGSTQNLQYDHLQPFALGGDSSLENIQLLCQSCNLRRGITTFGMRSMRRDGV